MTETLAEYIYKKNIPKQFKLMEILILKYPEKVVSLQTELMTYKILQQNNCNEYIFNFFSINNNRLFFY